MRINKNQRFKYLEELKYSILYYMNENKVTKKLIASEFKKKNIIGSAYPTILKKLDNPTEFKLSEIVILCNILKCSLNELLIKTEINEKNRNAD